MTDTTLSLTGLTAIAHSVGVTDAQARALMEYAGVKVQPEMPALPTEPGDVIIATKVRGETGKWEMVLDDIGEWYASPKIEGRRWHHPDEITAWTEAMVVPAGKKIDPDDVREGDRVRVVLNNGDEATITVTRVAPDFLTSERYVFYACNIRAIHLLDREEA